MKKLIIWVLMVMMNAQCAYAADVANIKIKISGSGSNHDNTYFLCMPEMGCLSILAAKKGKVFSMINAFEMNTLFITNARTLRVYNQGLPASCNVSVPKNKTITIYGHLQTKGDDKVVIKNFHCVIT